MYVVYRNNRKAFKTLFDSYERARQAVRRKIRLMTVDRRSGQPDLPMWSFGYEIRPV